LKKTVISILDSLLLSLILGLIGMGISKAPNSECRGRKDLFRLILDNGLLPDGPASRQVSGLLAGVSQGRPSPQCQEASA
jgi:hypothetical protein